MKCENCIHYDACKKISDVHGLAFGNSPFCDRFKDKSLFVELPCKIGETVYMPWKWNGQEGIACLKVTTMVDIIGLGLDFGTNFETDDDAYYEEYNGGRFKIEDVGKTVFLTQKEAEDKLKEIDENALT